ncbi:unnamed protein product [Effrenium voratum]|nr:unnamed protein product [Effrenium voratum]
MGEDFSLAQTLRLAFIHTMDLGGTGVVGALRKVFSYMRPPRELSKIDRITTAAAHLWWRTHDLEEAQQYIGSLHEADEALEWTLFTEADSGQDGKSWSDSQGQSEVCGARLRSVLHSVEGLARLLFSTLMLCWNIRRVLADEVADASARRLSFQEWAEINAKIEADGTTPSMAVQKCIYNVLLQDECPELLPDLMPTMESVLEGSLRQAGQVEGVTQTGWASIPTGGLERYELMPHGSHPGSGLSGAKLSRCVLSETSSSQRNDGFLQPELASANGEAVWLCLKHGFWLFLSTSPEDPAPYAFIRLQEAVMRETNVQERSVVLAGRMKKQEADSGPFGDSARHPLRLCFLLADGRFQLFEALWLELQFSSDEELRSWSRVLSSACLAEGEDGWV